ncbi:MAG: DNA double-strand break repair nuclease NurA [Candidatus Aenigmatarchaeota archaeon]
MENFFQLMEKFVTQIREMENQRIKLAEFLRKLKKVDFCQDGVEEKIIIKAGKNKLEKIRIGGVDGGLAKESFHGIDLILLKAIAVIFDFEDGKLKQVNYYPEPLPSPIPNVIFDPFSELEFELNSNMQRQMIEVEIATEAIKKFKPDLLLLDGSIVPHYVHRPESSSLLFQIYQQMIEAYKRLFLTAEENGTILAGVIEDSRGTRFCEILGEKLSLLPEIREARVLLEKTKDTNLLTYALNYGERTFAFSYSSEPEKHPILKEFGETGKKIFSFYLKAAEFDRPIRIDFLASLNAEEMAQKISSILLAICNSSTYAFPSVLIEADLRARLSEKEVEEFGLDLKSKLGNLASMLELRRKGRPF